MVHRGSLFAKNRRRKRTYTVSSSPVDWTEMNFESFIECNPSLNLRAGSLNVFNFRSHFGTANQVSVPREIYGKFDTHA